MTLDFRQDDDSPSLSSVVASIHADIEENGSEAVICAFGYRADDGTLRYALRSWGSATMALALCPVLERYVVETHGIVDDE